MWIIPWTSGTEDFRDLIEKPFVRPHGCYIRIEVYGNSFARESRDYILSVGTEDSDACIPDTAALEDSSS